MIPVHRPMAVILADTDYLILQTVRSTGCAVLDPRVNTLGVLPEQVLIQTNPLLLKGFVQDQDDDEVASLKLKNLALQSKVSSERVYSIASFCNYFDSPQNTQNLWEHFFRSVALGSDSLKDINISVSRSVYFHSAGSADRDIEY